MQAATDADTNPTPIHVGFADMVRESQSTFRAVIKALSRPGRHVTLPSTPTCPSGMPNGLAAIALTLADYETPVWLDKKLSTNEQVRQFIAFHTNAPVIDNPSGASFAILVEPMALPELNHFGQGSPEFPDRSTTLVIEVENLIGGPAITLQGPGIESTVTIEPVSLPSDFATRLTHNRALFPCGVDIILSAGNTIIGLPRSVRVVEG